MKYKIQGKDRKALKKELSLLNLAINRYWIDEDLADVYGHGQDKESANKILERLKNKRYAIKKLLAEKI